MPDGAFPAAARQCAESRPHREQVAIPAGITARAYTIAAEEAVTVARVLGAAFEALVHTYTGASDEVARSFRRWLHAGDTTATYPDVRIECRSDGLWTLTSPSRIGDEYLVLLDRALRYPDFIVGQAPLHEWIARRGECTPQATAVWCRGHSLSYGEWNERANRLANHLLELGAGPGTRVALFLRRSVHVPVAILAVLKAGAAYVPMDTDQPPARSGWMLDDCRPAVVLTTSDLAARLPDSAAKRVLLDTEWEQIEARSPGAPGILPRPASPAYVIYTSGSTGTPKGVVVPHRGIANLQRALGRRLEIGPQDAILQVSRYTFDISVTELLAAPACGARSVLAPPDGEWDPAGLVSLIRSEGVTYLQSVPSLYEVLLENGLAECSSVRHIVTGGEPLSQDLLARLREALPGAQVWNMYGPTEASVISTWWRAREGAKDGPIPIGVPLPNTQAHILRDDLAPVPDGEPGELCIGGEGLALEYLNRPALTAQRFVPNPFGEGRLYRTGDGGRIQENGEILFLGRLDDQVKIRGHRIELGEVEAALRRHPAVHSAAAAVRNTAAEKRLAAYIVFRGAPVNAHDLREFLRASLPEPMIPSHFLTLDSLPLNSNGKLDRNLLPELSRNSVAGCEFPAFGNSLPVTELPFQATIARIWAQVLGLERVPPEGHFFDLGGSSLSAMQAIAKLNRTLGLALPVAQLFRTPGLDAFTAAARAAQPGSAPTIVPRGDRGPAPLSCAQHAMWFSDRMSPGNPVFNLPWAVRLQGELDPVALERSLTAILERHSVLRTRYYEVSGEPVQEVLSPTRVSVPVTAAVAGEMESLLSEEARRPFRLDAGPMMRAKLFRLAPRDHVLLVTFHHIAFDGWSLGIFKRELAELYPAFRDGREPLPPRPALRYSDYCYWERERLAGEELERRLGYWRKTLAGAPPFLDLPCDLSRTGDAARAGRPERIHVGPQAAERVRALCLAERCTPFAVLLAAFEMLLHQWTGAGDLCVGVPVAERDTPELQDVLGYLVNTAVFRSVRGRREGFLDVLRRTRDASAAMHDSLSLPFPKMVQGLRPQRSPNRNPVFQVLFTLDSSAPAGFPGIEASEIQVETGAAEFDLSLYLAQSPGGQFDGWLTYDTGLFKPRTARRLAVEYLAILEKAMAPKTAGGFWRFLRR